MVFMTLWMIIWKNKSVGIVGYVFAIKVKSFIIDFCHYVLILIKYDEKACLFDQLLGWIHWKSKFT